MMMMMSFSVFADHDVDDDDIDDNELKCRYRS